MIDFAKGVFCATCKQANLFTRNVLINEELVQGDRTGNPFKNRQLCRDRAQLTVKTSLDHDLVLSISQC